MHRGKIWFEPKTLRYQAKRFSNQMASATTLYNSCRKGPNQNHGKHYQHCFSKHHDLAVHLLHSHTSLFFIKYLPCIYLGPFWVHKCPFLFSQLSSLQSPAPSVGIVWLTLYCGLLEISKKSTLGNDFTWYSNSILVQSVKTLNLLDNLRQSTTQDCAWHLVRLGMPPSVQSEALC